MFCVNIEYFICFFRNEIKLWHKYNGLMMLRVKWRELPKNWPFGKHLTTLALAFHNFSYKLLEYVVL